MFASSIYTAPYVGQVRIIDGLTSYTPPEVNNNRRTPVEPGLIPCAQNGVGRIRPANRHRTPPVARSPHPGDSVRGKSKLASLR